MTPDQINELSKNWKQGDCVIGDCSFLFGFASSCPLKSGLEKNIDEKIDFVQELVFGFAILTQTCDIVRDCLKKPYIEVAPLQIEKAHYPQIKNFKMISYLAIPALEPEHIVANLEKTMTFEKSVFSIWDNKSNFKFVRGFNTDKEIEGLSLALSRKRSRFAFPDQFNQTINPFLKRIKEKHGKNSEEGQMLDKITEIRVNSEPDWYSQNCRLTFYFLIDREQIGAWDWGSQIEKWKGLVNRSGTPYSEVEMLVFDYDDITAREYKESKPLDLNDLSLEIA